MKTNEINISEKGIAIVFALGVISLLLVIALGFVTTAIITKKTEENLSSLTIARMTAESGLQRVMAVMKANSSNPDIDYWDIASHEPGADSDPVYYEDLPTLMANIEDGEGHEVFDWDTYYPSASYDPSNSDHITWQYLPSGHDINTPMGTRFAYVVVNSLSSSGKYCLSGKKIDPSASIDLGLNAHNNSTYAISENYPASEATSIGSDGSPVIGRPGRDISELFLTTLPFVTQADTAEKLSATNADPAGLLAYGTRWGSLNTLCDSFSASGTPITAETKDSFKNYFEYYHIAAPEAWANSDSYNVGTYAGLYHRFNLTRSNWNSLSVSDICDTVNNIIPFDPNDNGDIEKCIQWLANWKYEGGFGDTVDSYNNCKNQITANLIDYNDSNNGATTDNENSPTYVGLEKNPYINELKLEVEAEVEESGGSGNGLFVNNNLNIQGNYNTFSGGHVNANIVFGSQWRQGNSTSGSTINYIGTVTNQGNGNQDFLTNKVGTSISQVSKPAEPSVPPAIGSISTPTIPTITLPSSINARNYSSKPNTYSYNQSIFLEEAAGGGIKVYRSNGNLYGTIPNDSIIYNSGKNKYININSSTSGFNRQLTLISSKGKVNIYRHNTVLTPASNSDGIQLYSNKALYLGGNGCSFGGNIYGTNTITIDGSGGNYSGYIYGKTIAADGANCTFGSIYSYKNNLNFWENATNCTAGLVYSNKAVNIDSSGNTIDTIYSKISTTINKPDNTITYVYSNINTTLNTDAEKSNIGTIYSVKDTIIYSPENEIDIIYSGDDSMFGSNADDCIIGNMKTAGDDATINSSGNTFTAIETKDLFKIESAATNNTIGSAKGTKFFNYANNTQINALEFAGTFYLYGSNGTYGNIKNSENIIIGDHWNGQNINISGTVWSDKNITVYGKNNTIGSIRSGGFVKLKDTCTGLIITKMIWSADDIIMQESTATYSIPILCATDRIYNGNWNKTTINNSSLVWSGGDITLYTSIIRNTSISCGGNLTIKGNNTDISGGSSGAATYTANVLLKDIDLELVNMYDETDTCQANIIIEGTYNWILGGTDSEVNFSKALTLNNFSAPAEAYTVSVYDGSDSSISPATTRTGSAGQSTSIEDFDLTNITVKLSYGFNFYDFAYIDDNSVTDSETITSDGAQASYYYDYQVPDPRQNLLVAEWLKQDASSSSIGTIGAENSNWDPVSDGINSDMELDTAPWNISTAYIRNTTMKSPWEVGFIHRGQAWQTINLKKYNSTEDITGGGNTYSDGDANILDQVKMSSDTQTYGKVNVNTDLPEVLKVLVQKINIGSNVGSSDGPGVLSGTEIDATDAQTLAEAFINNSLSDTTDTTQHFYTRAQIVRNSNGVSELYNNSLGLSQITDATQEELIGKFINLTTALEQLPDQYTIIVVAQTIKDVGINGSSSTVDVNGVACQAGRYDVGGDEILGTQKILATIRRNPFTDKFYIVEYKYLD